MTTNQTTDPRVAQALDLFTRVGDLLSRAERVVRTADSVPRLDVVLRALMQCQHSMAIAWNAALANVPERKPEPPPVPPKAAPKAPPPYDPTVPALTQRILAEGDDREFRRALPEGPLEWQTK